MGSSAIVVAAGLALTTRRRLIVLPCSSVKLVRVPDTIISFRRFWMTGTGGQENLKNIADKELRFSRPCRFGVAWPQYITMIAG